MQRKRECMLCKKKPGIIPFQNNEKNKIEGFVCEDCAKEKGFTFTEMDANDLLNTLQNLFKGERRKKEDDKIDFFEKEELMRPLRFQYSGEKKEQKKKSLLEESCMNINKMVIKNQIDPLISREKEIEQMIHILNRRRKNNPVLIGEPGVGKTAIAEGLAKRIVDEQVPEKLKEKTIYLLDMANITAGTMYRGTFEEKMKNILTEVEERTDVILFIDELHLIMGAGASMENKMDAGNILKPYLSRGKVRLIGATTLDEYRVIEKDSALSRRFQPIKIDEPTIKETIEILKGIKHIYEKEHKITYTDEVIETCVKLSDRYINERFMPDKAIDLLDEIGAKLNLKYNIVDENTEKRIKSLYEKEKDASERENYEEVSNYKHKRLILETNFARNKNKVYRAEIKDVEELVEKKTGIPVSSLNIDDKEGLKTFEKKLKANVIGQDEAIEKVSKAVKRRRINIKKSKKPTTFLFVGPTGVGKTELAKKLTKEVYGDEKSIIRFDMSEFMEPHSLSKLIGSPPGYIGHDKAGVLTEKVRRTPYSVILLDEFEKAHKEIQHLFLQVFDDGRLTDAQGKTVDFSNTIIIMTSNLGTKEPKSTGFIKKTETEHFTKAIHDYFAPEFINRIDSVIPFKHLKEENMLEILELQLKEVIDGMLEKNILLSINHEAKLWLVEKGYDEKFGARPLSRIITTEIEDNLVELLIDLEKVKEINVTLENNELKFNAK